MAAFFVNNGFNQPDLMECRNLVTAREMVQDGHWLVPTMNGELRVEKPVLPTWMAAVVMLCGGDSLGAQRAVAGLMGLLWTMFMYATAVYLTRSRDYGRMAVLVFVTCYPVILMGRTASWDVFCHAFMMGGIYCLLRLLYDKPHEMPRSTLNSQHSTKTGGWRLWRWALAAGLLIGLSFQSKGPVSFYALLLPFVIAMLLWQRPDMRGRWRPLLLVVVLVVLSGWWYVVLLVFYREETRLVVQKETSAWSGHNVRPPYYYWRFFAETGVWALLTLAAIVVPLCKHPESTPSPRGGQRPTLNPQLSTKRREWNLKFSVIWMLAALVLLSLMPEKKMRYLLPMMAPCAFAVTHLLSTSAPRHPIVEGILRVNGYVVSAVAAVLAVLVIAVGPGRGMPDFGSALFTGLLILVVAGWMWLSTRRGRFLDFVYGVAALFVVAECFLAYPVASMLQPSHAASAPQRPILGDIGREMAWYHNEAESVDMRFVYATGKKVRPLDLKNGTAVEKVLPCVVVTHDALNKVLASEVLNRVDTTRNYVYDSNTHSKDFHHYRKENIYRIYVLSPSLAP